MAISLSINLNKVALLRNSRGASNPSPRVAAETCIHAGANGITLHWREDNRHARASDVRELCALAKQHRVEFNLEGDARAELVDLALEIRPTQFTLVPVITSLPALPTTEARPVTALEIPGPVRVERLKVTGTA